MRKLWLLMALLALLVVPLAFSEENNTQTEEVELAFFYSSGCPVCARMEPFIDELEQNNKLLEVKKYEVRDSLDLFFEYADKYNLEVGGSISVPVVFIKEKVFVGFNDNIKKALEEYVQECINITYCPFPGNGSENITRTQGPSDVVLPETNLGVTLPAVIGAAAVDAINPCEFAVLIILLTTILATQSKKKALLAGLAFSASIFISYFLMGLGLYSAVQASGFTHWFYIVVAVLAIIVGLFNLKDYLWYGKWFVMEVPLSWRPRLKAVVRGVTSVPGAFLIGFVVSLFLLPCTSGPYIVILGLLAETTTRNYAMLMLLLYNVIFILPMLFITGAISFGFTTTERAEEWRQRNLKVLHLIAGIIILLVGIGMIIALMLGMV